MLRSAPLRSARVPSRSCHLPSSPGRGVRGRLRSFGKASYAVGSHVDAHARARRWLSRATADSHESPVPWRQGGLPSLLATASTVINGEASPGPPYQGHGCGQTTRPTPSAPGHMAAPAAERSPQTRSGRRCPDRLKRTAVLGLQLFCVPWGHDPAATTAPRARVGPLKRRNESIPGIGEKSRWCMVVAVANPPHSLCTSGHSSGNGVHYFNVGPLVFSAPWSHTHSSREIRRGTRG